jgi:hypothetical protein
MMGKIMEVLLTAIGRPVGEPLRVVTKSMIIDIKNDDLYVAHYGIGHVMRRTVNGTFFEAARVTFVCLSMHECVWWVHK